MWTDAAWPLVLVPVVWMLVDGGALQVWLEQGDGGLYHLIHDLRTGVMVHDTLFEWTQTL